MRLTYDAGSRRFLVECRYQEKDYVKSCGFQWDPENRVWWTKDPVLAVSFFDVADELAREQFLSNERRFEESRSIRDHNPISVPCPRGLSYLPFQLSGIRQMMERGNVLLADQMGLGKTVQVLGLMNLLGREACLPALIVCPASLKRMWRDEIGRWITFPAKVDVVHSSSTFPESPEIVVTNYESLPKFRVPLRGHRWRILVCDEAHYLKNPSAVRTREILGDRDEILPVEAERKIFLTGTPMLNRPVEIWTLVHALDPDVFWSYRRFVERYCAAKETGYGLDVRGASNLHELEYKLRATVMIRRTKDEVLPELPPKIRQVVSLPPDDAGSAIAIAEEWAAYERRSAEMMEAWLGIAKAKLSGDQESYRNAVKRLRAFIGRSLGEMAEARLRVALAKVPKMEGLLWDAVCSSGKVVVWAYHHDVIDMLASMFRSEAVVFDGRMTDEQKKRSVELFCGDESVRMFIGSIRAAGLGLNLSVASHVIFVELDWVPSIVVQAEDRCHRIGQTGSVFVQHVVLEGSIDAYVARVMVEKQKVIEQAIDGKEVELNEPVLPPVKSLLDERKQQAVWFLLKRLIDIGVENQRRERIEDLLSGTPDPVRCSLGLSHVMACVGSLMSDQPSEKALRVLGVKVP